MRHLLCLVLAVLLAISPASADLFINNLHSFDATGNLPFSGGAKSYSDLKSLCEQMARFKAVAPTETTDDLTINGQNLGDWGYVIKDGNQTVSSFTNSDWFASTTNDQFYRVVVVKGDLTINGGQTFIPTGRAKGLLVCVTGNLAVSGSISMSARGANHSGTGVSQAAVAIRIATGTFSAVSDPQIPAAGGGGASGANGSGTITGATGTAGSSGGMGGGGAGGHLGNNGFSCTTGGGAAGTSFSGGSGGGGCYTYSGNIGTAGSGGASGAAGGAAIGCCGDSSAGGGAGNGGGSGTGGGPTGGAGTGGGLVIIVKGALSGAGTIVANGVSGGNGSAGGGSSGGGSVTVMYGSDSSSITPTASGGTAVGGSVSSGAGGAGTARKLAL